MSARSSLTLALITVGLLSQPLLSQTAAPRSAREQLQALKAANDKLLEQQKVTLTKLEEAQKDAAQLRIFVRRN